MADLHEANPHVSEVKNSTGSSGSQGEAAMPTHVSNALNNGRGPTSSSETDEQPRSSEDDTRVDRFKKWVMNHPMLSILIIIGIVIIALAKFTDALATLNDKVIEIKTRIQGPSAHLEVKQHSTGVATLSFKFLNPSRGFSVDKIILNLKQITPVMPVGGNPSGQVVPAFFTAEIPAGIFDRDKPQIEADIRLYHDSKEPYALGEVCLWFARPQSRVRVLVRPEYRDARGNHLNIPTQPAQVEILVENRPDVNATSMLGQSQASFGKALCSEVNR